MLARPAICAAIISSVLRTILQLTFSTHCRSPGLQSNMLTITAKKCCASRPTGMSLCSAAFCVLLLAVFLLFSAVPCCNWSLLYSAVLCCIPPLSALAALCYSLVALCHLLLPALWLLSLSAVAVIAIFRLFLFAN